MQNNSVNFFYEDSRNSKCDSIVYLFLFAQDLQVFIVNLNINYKHNKNSKFGFAGLYIRPKYLIKISLVLYMFTLVNISVHDESRILIG